MMKRTTLILILMTLTTTLSAKPRVDDVHPLCWWAGMAEPTFQILLHGEEIGSQEVELADAEGIQLAESSAPRTPTTLFCI